MQSKNVVLYKNLEKKYYHSFKEKGSIRVGTLNLYKAIEGTRQDDKEGLKLLGFNPEEEIHLNKDEIPANLFPSFITVPNVNIHLSPGASLNLGVQIPNAYIFCVSEKPIPGKFGDSHYEIIYPSIFCKMLFEKLKELDPEVNSACLRKISYGGIKDLEVRTVKDLERYKNYNLNEISLSDYFTKPSKFSDEFEYRYVFFTATPNIREFLDLTCDLKIIHSCCNFP